MNHRVTGHDADKLLFLLGRRQFAVEQQVAGFEIVRVLGQLFYGITAMKQNAFFAVDKGDLRFASGGGGEARVIGKVAVGCQLAYVNNIRPQRA